MYEDEFAIFRKSRKTGKLKLQKAEARESSQVQGHPGPHSEFQDSLDYRIELFQIFKKQKFLE